MSSTSGLGTWTSNPQGHMRYPVFLSPGSKSLPSQSNQEAVCLTRLMQMLNKNGSLLWVLLIHSTAMAHATLSLTYSDNRRNIFMFTETVYFGLWSVPPQGGWTFHMPFWWPFCVSGSYKDAPAAFLPSVPWDPPWDIDCLCLQVPWTPGTLLLWMEFLPSTSVEGCARFSSLVSGSFPPQMLLSLSTQGQLFLPQMKLLLCLLHSIWCFPSYLHLGLRLPFL